MVPSAAAVRPDAARYADRLQVRGSAEATAARAIHAGRTSRIRALIVVSLPVRGRLKRGTIQGPARQIPSQFVAGTRGLFSVLQAGRAGKPRPKPAWTGRCHPVQPDTDIARMRCASLSPTYSVPRRSTNTPWGRANAQRRGSGSGPSPRWPVPSTVPMMPGAKSIPRMTWLSVSATNSRPRHHARPLGPARSALSRRAAVARVALVAGAGHVMDRLRPGVDAIDGVALAQRQVEIAAVVERHRARAVQRRARDRRAVGRGLAVTRAGEGGDDAGGQIDRPHAMVADVADEQSPAVGRRPRCMRLAEGGRGRRPAVSREARLPGAGQASRSPWCVASTLRTTWLSRSAM